MSPLRRLALVLWTAVFLLGGFLAAQRWLPSSPPPAPPAAPAATAATAATAEAPASSPAPAPTLLPEITLKDLSGKPRSLSEWQGRTRLINFWATWCAPCRKEMPLLQQLAEGSDPASLAVIGIAIDRLEPVIRFVGETGVTYPVLAGEMDATRAAEQFGDAFNGLPFSVIAGPDGTLLGIHTGELTAADLAKIGEIAAMLHDGRLTIPEAQAALAAAPPEDAAP